MNSKYRDPIKPRYSPLVDGNVFEWILSSAEAYRQIKKAHVNAILKEASTESKRLDQSEMAY